MTTFADNMIAKGLPLLMAQFGESVVYRPREGMPRTLTAIIDREPPQAVIGTEAPTFKYMVTVIADRTAATYGGIEATEVDTGGDKIDLAPRPGNAVSSRQVAVVLQSDHGALVLGVR